MRITDLLKACSVELNGTPQTKEETIKQMVALMEKGGNVTDVEKYKAGVFAREEEGTTGIGEGLQSLMQRPMQLMHRGLQQW